MNKIDRLTQHMSRLPGLGPRSAKRAVLHLLAHRPVMRSLASMIAEAERDIRACSTCGNLDDVDPCWICTDPRRDASHLCVVEQVDDLWAVERSGTFSGRYHVLGGVLSAVDGVGPDELGMDRLLARVKGGHVQEVILALSATVEGQATGHYLAEKLKSGQATVSRIAHGVPVGGELNYLDDGTLGAAMLARRAVDRN